MNKSMYNEDVIDLKTRKSPVKFHINYMIFTYLGYEIPLSLYGLIYDGYVGFSQ